MRFHPIRVRCRNRELNSCFFLAGPRPVQERLMEITHCPLPHPEFRAQLHRHRLRSAMVLDKI